MQPVVDFMFDFGSPNAYLAYKILAGITKRADAKVNLIPCLLGGIFKATGNQSPMAAFGHIKGKLEYEALETQRFIDRHGLSKFRFNPHFPVNTLLIMRGLVAARRADIEADYIEAVLSGMWETGLKMDDPEIFVATLNASGLPAQALLTATQDPEVKAGLLANTEQAVQRGVFGIPTFFVGKEMFFGKDRLGQVEDALVKAH